MAVAAAGHRLPLISDSKTLRFSFPAMRRQLRMLPAISFTSNGKGPSVFVVFDFESREATRIEACYDRLRRWGVTTHEYDARMNAGVRTFNQPPLQGL